MILAALALLLGLAFQDDPRALVERLRSDSVIERDAAAKRLSALGEAARAELEKAARDPDAEVAGRAARILRVLEIRSRVPPRLKAAVPGIEERLAADQDRAWTEAFFAAMGRPMADRPPAPIEREDLDFLVARALRGAAAEGERTALCQTAARNNLRAAIPELVRLLSDPSDTGRYVAKRALVQLDAREAAPELSALLGAGSPDASDAALTILVQLEAREAAPGLVEHLRSERDDVRANAAAALGKLGTAETARELRPLLRDRSAWVSGEAAEALGALGSKEAVPELRALLRDPERGVQGEAARALGRLGAREAAPDLVEALRKPGRHDAREEVARALGDLGHREALPMLLDLLEDRDFQGQAAVLPIVARLGGPAAAPRIVACFRHEDAEVREAAVAAARPLGIRGLGPALAGLLEDSSDAVVREAAEALLETGAAEVAAKLEALVANESAREIGRRWAALVLGRSRPPGAAPFLLERARDAGIPVGLRVCILHALADLGSKEAAGDLRKLLASKDEETRAAAVRAIGRLGLRDAAPELRRILAEADGDYDLREAAAGALAALADPEALPLLRRAIEEGDFPGTAALALAELGDRDSVPALLDVLHSRGDDERRDATDALARLDPAAALARLRERLKDPRSEVRGAAASSLCRLGSREGVPALLEAARWDARQSLTPLNAVRSPARWKELRDRKVAWMLPGGSIASDRLLRLVSGMTVETEEEGRSAWIFGMDIDEEWRSALHLLEDYEDDFILEGDRLRVLPRHKAFRFWQEWWRAEGGR